MEILKPHSGQPEKPAREKITLPQKEAAKEQFDLTIALGSEKNLLEKSHGKAKKIAKILILISSLIAEKEAVSATRALEKPPAEIAQVEKEKEIPAEVSNFINLSHEEQIRYLKTLVKKPVKYRRTEERRQGQKVQIRESVIEEESGVSKIVELKEQLDELYEKESDPKRKEKTNQSFLTVHRFTLEYGFWGYDKQALDIYNFYSSEPSQINVYKMLIEAKNGRPIYNPNETDVFLEESEKGYQPGPHLTVFLKEVKKVSGSELSKIKQIYDLVAYHVPRYKLYRGKGEIRGYGRHQTFEQLLEKKAGVCLEKNALLTHALRQAGIEAYLCLTGEHAFTRVFTAEGCLDIDITNSEPFSLRKLATQGEYSFRTPKFGLEMIPLNIYQYAEKRRQTESLFYKTTESPFYFVSIPLDSDETIEYAAKEKSFISTDMLKKILTEIENVKPHPLYDIGKRGAGIITPENSGKYSKDLFKERIINE